MYLFGFQPWLLWRHGTKEVNFGPFLLRKPKGTLRFTVPSVPAWLSFHLTLFTVLSRPCLTQFLLEIVYCPIPSLLVSVFTKISCSVLLSSECFSDLTVICCLFKENCQTIWCWKWQKSRISIHSNDHLIRFPSMRNSCDNCLTIDATFWAKMWEKPKTFTRKLAIHNPLSSKSC